MAGALVFPVAGFEVTAVVRRVEDDGVVQHVEAEEGVAQPAQGLVQALHHAVVATQVLLAGTSQCQQVRRRPAAGIPFAVAVGRREVIQVVLVVWLDVGNKQEERIVLVFVDVADDGVGLGIDAVTRHLDRLVVAVVHDAVVGVRRELQGVGGQPVVVSEAPVSGHRSPGTCIQVPLADVAGVVAAFPEAVGQGARVLG